VDSKASTATEGIQGIADRGLKLDPATAAVVAKLLAHAASIFLQDRTRACSALRA
jgi:hypothetical protein